MWVEMSRSYFEKLRAKLEQMHLNLEISDCTLPGETEGKVHVELGSLNADQKTQIEQELAYIYNAPVYQTPEGEKDVDRNGIADDKEEPEAVREVRRRPWDDRAHTAGEEALGYLSGESMREEVTYERI